MIREGTIRSVAVEAGEWLNRGFTRSTLVGMATTTASCTPWRARFRPRHTAKATTSGPMDEKLRCTPDLVSAAHSWNSSRMTEQIISIASWNFLADVGSFNTVRFYFSNAFKTANIETVAPSFSDTYVSQGCARQALFLPGHDSAWMEDCCGWFGAGMLLNEWLCLRFPPTGLILD